MNGTSDYEGVFLPNTGNNPIPATDLKISVEETGRSSSTWARIDEQQVPLVFLKNGTVLIPKEAFKEGQARLQYMRQVQGK